VVRGDSDQGWFRLRRRFECRRNTHGSSRRSIFSAAWAAWSL
jgi:hypothetical protein